MDSQSKRIYFQVASKGLTISVLLNVPLKKCIAFAASTISLLRRKIWNSCRCFQNHENHFYVSHVELQHIKWRRRDVWKIQEERTNEKVFQAWNLFYRDDRLFNYFPWGSYGARGGGWERKKGWLLKNRWKCECCPVVK